MAKHVLINPTVTLNAVDMSDHVEVMEFTLTTADGGNAAGMGETQSFGLPGVRVISPISLTMFQDFAASDVYATLYALWAARTVFDCVLTNDGATPGATNPEFTVPVYISSFPVISGTRGERHMTQVVLAPAGTLVVATS